MDSVGDGQLSLLIEDVDLLGIESEGHALSGTDLGVRLDTSGNRIAVNIEIQENFSAEQLVDVAGCIELVSSFLKSLRGSQDVFRTDAEDNLLAVVVAVDHGLRLVSGKLDALAVEFEISLALRNPCGSIQEVHLRGSHEACDEEIAGVVIEVLRGIDLLNDTVLHNDDSGSQSHSLGLVMCDVDDGGAQSLVKLGNLGSHLNTELGIQVGQRLVHQEYLGASDDCTAHGDTLSLAAGKSLRLTVKEMGQVEDL